jgi:hypothetical protein
MPQHTTITLEQLLLNFGPKKVLAAVARICETLATEDQVGLWPAWVQSADAIVDCSAMVPDFIGHVDPGSSAPRVHVWTRKLVS